MFFIIGTTTVDLVVTGMEALPRLEGDEFTANSLAFCDRPLNISLGGNGANTAYVLGGMGAAVMLCSAVGRDDLGDLMAGWLRAKGVDLRAVLRSDRDGTATNTTIVDPRANRMSFYYPGPFTRLDQDDFPAELLGESRALLATGYVLLPGFRPAGYQAVFQTARQRGIVTALDIGPAIEPPARLDEITALLPLVDYFIANEYELAVCTGESSVEAGVERLLAAGANTAIIKRGGEGALVRSSPAAGGVDLTVDGFPVRAAMTIGAGDSFNAGFLYALDRGLPLAKAVRYGNAAAALVLNAGGVLGAPSNDEIERLLADGAIS
jgi:sugar/nucleoside kinase (ribokinase family)